MPLPPVNHGFTVMRAEGGGLGLLLLSDLTAQFWKRNADCGGDGASWVLGKTVDLGELLPVDSKEERWPLRILGLAEDHNVALLWTYPCLFTVQLDSLQFRKLFQSKNMCPYHPFEAVYTAGITYRTKLFDILMLLLLDHVVRVRAILLGTAIHGIKQWTQRLAENYFSEKW